MRGPPRADHDGPHLVRTDQRLRGVEDLGTFRRGCGGAAAVDIAHRHDAGAAEHLGETADVILADHPRPDDTDGKRHGSCPYLKYLSM